LNHLDAGGALSVHGRRSTQVPDEGRFGLCEGRALEVESGTEREAASREERAGSTLQASAGQSSNDSAEDRAPHRTTPVASKAGRLGIDWKEVGFWVAYFTGAIALSFGIAILCMFITLGIV